jgi:hypothetical protein
MSQSLREKDNWRLVYKHRMPPVFDYVDDTGHTFRGSLVARECAADGCRNVVSYALPYCAAHTRVIYGISVQPSVVEPGDGLFVVAAEGLPPGYPICPFVSETVSERTLRKRYGTDGTGPLVIRGADGTLWDGALVRGIAFHARSIFRAVPSKAGRLVPDSALSNAVLDFLYLDDDKKPSRAAQPWLVSRLPIPCGVEIVVDFGHYYQIAVPGKAVYTTTR